MQRLPFLAVLLVASVAVAGCGRTDPGEPTLTLRPDVPPLPPADTAAAEALIGPDETLQVLEFAQDGSTTVTGTVDGYRSTAYAVPVASAQTLTVTFQPASQNLYMNVQNAADPSGAAVHRGEVDGPTSSLIAPEAGTYVIRPFQPRASARRGETVTYTITIARQ
ncbi:MAG: hypothetical protein AAFX81_17070 [Pseudomonadota bacterium]